MSLRLNSNQRPPEPHSAGRVQKGPLFRAFSQSAFSADYEFYGDYCLWGIVDINLTRLLGSSTAIPGLFRKKPVFEAIAQLRHGAGTEHQLRSRGSGHEPRSGQKLLHDPRNHIVRVLSRHVIVDPISHPRTGSIVVRPAADEDIFLRPGVGAGPYTERISEIVSAPLPTSRRKK
jgi:hypothetical protein